MELKRDIYSQLLKWKEKDTGRVLELQGARQVGKTYIFKKFAKENFSHTIYINMAEFSGENFLRCLKSATDWVIGEERPKRPLYDALKLFDKSFCDEKGTIIILDEVQESTLVYNQIRTFAREFQCYVVVTGSYLGETLQSEFFLPAGDTDNLTMETLTFKEFLEVCGEIELYTQVDIFKRIPKKKKRMRN